MREMPEGFRLDWDNTTWNIGFVFEWSEPFKKYILRGTITIRPNQSLAEAFGSLEGQRFCEAGKESLGSRHEIFFSA